MSTFGNLAIRIQYADHLIPYDRIRVYDWTKPDTLQFGVNMSEFRGHPLTVNELRKTLDDLERHAMSAIIAYDPKES